MGQGGVVFCEAGVYDDEQSVDDSGVLGVMAVSNGSEIED